MPCLLGRSSPTPPPPPSPIPLLLPKSLHKKPCCIKRVFTLHSLCMLHSIRVKFIQRLEDALPAGRSCPLLYLPLSPYSTITSKALQHKRVFTLHSLSMPHSIRVKFIQRLEDALPAVVQVLR